MALPPVSTDTAAPIAAPPPPAPELPPAVMLLREHCPEIKIRVVNVVDLFTPQLAKTHPHRLGDEAHDSIFPPQTPVIFAFHGYPSLIHQLAYSRRNHAHLHVHDYRETRTTTTPFDLCVMNQLDCFHLALNAVSRIPSQSEIAIRGEDAIGKKLAELHHREPEEKFDDDRIEDVDEKCADEGDDQEGLE